MDFTSKLIDFSYNILIFHPNLGLFLLTASILTFFLSSIYLFKNSTRTLNTLKVVLIRIIFRIKKIAFFQAIISLVYFLLSKAVRVLKLFLIWTEKFLTKDTMSLFIGLLLLVILTRFSISYSDKALILVPPEKNFIVTPIGVDFFLATVKPAINIIKGENFYYYTANYGPSFSLITIPFLFLLNSSNSCLINSLLCSEVLYNWLIFITIFGYIYFILFYFNKKNRNPFLIFFIGFLLSRSGSLGLERGNIDIIFSLFVGFLILIILKSWKLPTKSLRSIFFSILIGFISGFIANSKIFLIPFVFISVFSARNLKVALASCFITFISLSYIPNFFGSKSDFIDPLRVALVFEKSIRFGVLGSININHSFSSFLSVFTDCVQNQACDKGLDSSLAALAGFIILFFMIFIFPFMKLSYFTKKSFFLIIKTPKSKRIIFFLTKLRNILISLYKRREDAKLLMLLFVFFDAFINLIPVIAFDYRLFYSLPLVFFQLKFCEKNSKAKYYCLLSMIFLILKGLWIFLNIGDTRIFFLDIRGMNIFVLLHFYFLIKSAVENYKKDFSLNKKLFRSK